MEAVPADEFGAWRSWVGECKDLDTWGMPDCQSGAAFPLAAAPVPVSLRMATNRICQADCHEESCGNALYDVACSSATSVRLFPGERDGRSLAQRSVQRGEVAAEQRARSNVCRIGQIGRIGIHHSWGVTVRAAGR